jgi:rhodanese-related sulfurtransferase
VAVVRSITVAELKAVVEQGGAQVVDVREPWEYADGHVPGARLVPLADVPTLVGQLPVDEPIYLVCAVGGRSGQAAQFLARHGVESVNVLGGTGEWVAAGYPVER